DHPFDAVEQHALAAGEPRMRLLPRRVIGEFFEYRPRAGKPFLAHEAHWPTADILGDRLERIGRRDPRRHDEAGWRSDFAERDQEFGERFFKHPAEGAVVDGGKLLLDVSDHQTHIVARLPAPEACHDIFREHALAVVKLQFRSQTECPHESVGRYLLAIDHLAPRLKFVVEAIKHVPHQRGGIAHDVLGVPDRIEIGEVRLRHEAQYARLSALADRWGGKTAGRSENTGRGLDECASIHDRPHTIKPFWPRPKRTAAAPTQSR